MSRVGIVLHHSLTKDGDTVSAQAIRKYHVEKLGWKDVGYHYLIEKVGDEYEVLLGRPESSDAAAVKEGKVNRTHIHVCLVGNFDEEAPPQELLDVLVKRLLVPCLRRNRLGYMAIYGHSQYAPYKSCPGTKFDLDLVRQMTKEELSK